MSRTLVFGVLWQLTRIIDDLTKDGRWLPHPRLTVLLVVQTVGWVGWDVWLFRMAAWQKRLRADPVVAEVVGDEFYQQVRLTAQVGADSTIFVARTTAPAAFLRLEHA